MVDAARPAGTADRGGVLAVPPRRLAGRRRYGVVGGTGRVLEAVAGFRLTEDELRWLGDAKILDSGTLDWLADYRFTGQIRGYREGEIYFPGSPILVVE